jgi:2-keto-4-pentenoate hydratase
VIEALAAKLDAAWETGTAIEPLSEADAVTPADAYEIQHAWTSLRRARGETIFGRKIGLTSAAIRRQAGVDEPDYGSLWGSRYYPVVGGRAEVEAAPFLQPRVEGEVAFLLGRTLSGGAITAQDVLAATDALAASIEIVDSRIKDWRLTIADTVADNASYGGFLHGPWSRALRYVDLGTLGMVLRRNGDVAVTGVGVEALDGPAHAVAWLANKLHTFGEVLEAGAIVLSGSLGAAVPAAAGDVFTLQVTGQPPLTVTFT